MNRPKSEGVAAMLRGLVLEDGDARDRAQRMMTLFVLGSMGGLTIRRDARARGIAEIVRRTAVSNGLIEGSVASGEPVVFDYPGSDLVCGFASVGGKTLVFCHAEEVQRGFVLVTDGARAEQCDLTIPLSSREPSDVPGAETVH